MATRRFRPLPLLAVLVVASIFRLANLSEAPAGLQVDEASNAWNTWCLLHTGRDQHGVRWPILDAKGYGQGSTTLLLYLALPFEAIAGLTPLGIRLPGVLCGLLSIALVYLACRAIFGDFTSTIAALFVALSPGAIQLSRSGHQAVVFPLVAAGMLAISTALLSEKENPILKGAAAGAIAGVAVYGYYAIRLWLPIFIICTSLVLLPGIRRHWRAAAAFFAALGFVVLPLALATVSRPALRQRAAITWVWNSSDTPKERIMKVITRYPPHFGLDYLTRRGDPDPSMSPPPGFGILQRFMLPFLVFGLVALVRTARDSLSSRVLLVAVVLYPVADLLSEHPTSHAFRSAPGVVVLPIACAVGFVTAYEWLEARGALLAQSMAVIVAAWAIVGSLQYANALFESLDRDEMHFFAHHVDMLRAAQWLAPRLQAADAALVTGSAGGHPYMYTLVGMRYSPDQWLRDSKRFVMGPLPNGAYSHEEVCLRYGKVNFYFGSLGLELLEEFRSGYRRGRILVVRRPGELTDVALPSASFSIRDPNGAIVLEAIEASF